MLLVSILLNMMNSNKKDEQWYINTNQSYAFGSGKVTATYGTATAKAHADVILQHKMKQMV